MERWTKIDCLPGYEGTIEVSDHGNVRVRNRCYRLRSKWGTVTQQTKPDMLISGEVAKTGYRVVSFYVRRKRHKFFVHRLVAMAYVKGFQDGMTVNHKNGVKTDNRAENLEWVTLSDNTRHQWASGLVDLRGDNHPSAKLSSVSVREIREKLRIGQPCLRIAKEYGVSSSLVELIRDGKRWSSVT